MEELNAPNTVDGIELKESRNGLPVPVVNGVHLHSIYNPVKEAQAFASEYVSSVKRRPNLLVLGLGFGYHIDELAKLAGAIRENYKVLVLEPNEELAQLFLSTRGFESPNIKVVSSQSPTEVFNRLDFIEFLTTKPAIIKHETSFNLNKAYFVGFLTFKAPKEMKAYSTLLSDDAQKHFPVFEGTIEESLTKAKESGRIENKKDFLLFALDAIVRSARAAEEKAAN